MDTREQRDAWIRRHGAASQRAAPSPFVVRGLQLLAQGASSRGPACSSRPLALDLACGRGRHAILLAQHGYRVEAVDYALPALMSLKAEAASRALAVTCIAADVTAWPLPRNRYQLVLVVNFLERGCFAALRAAVRPGGALLLETFLEGQERYGHPRNPAYLLRRGELARAFGDWEILQSHEGRTEHDGRAAVLAGILARRPS